jgi:UDP-N-acetylglucosamine--N-acetylmuramyl-(pentapeptide) pyrophosphoryl-undecaprenol N-acetylglucosamine transferase
MGQGLWESRRLIARLKPDIVVGFGGYPTVPPLAAARLARLPILVHEQNAVLGRANRLLVALGAVLATGFENPKGSAKARRAVQVGNPVRAAVAAAAAPYVAAEAEAPFNLLVFGGSQGARVFSGLVPGALAQLAPERRARLRIVQQARAEDAAATQAAFAGVGVEAVVSPFFDDLPARIAACHLALCRAGASSVSELAAIGRPAILVPYPHALDHDQAANAAVLAAKGGAWIVPERELTPEALARRLATLMDDPRALEAAAAAAAATGRTDAAERLADLVGELARS